MDMRLDRFLSNMGEGSRRDVRRLILDGGVAVNGETVFTFDRKLDPETDRVELFGRVISFKKERYLMMNKPKGVVSATEDGRERTVLDLLSEEDRRFSFFPAGRLDKNTTGFVLLTTDGRAAHSLLSPKKHVDKTYEALLDKKAAAEDIEAFQNGIELDGGYVTKPAGLIIDEGDPKKCVVILREGKYHQIKRMFKTRGKNVVGLKRLAIGGLFLDESLKEGEYRELKHEELALLFGPIG